MHAVSAPVEVLRLLVKYSVMPSEHLARFFIAHTLAHQVSLCTFVIILWNRAELIELVSDGLEQPVRLLSSEQVRGVIASCQFFLLLFNGLHVRKDLLGKGCLDAFVEAMPLTELKSQLVCLSLITPLNDDILHFALSQVYRYPDHFWVRLNGCH